ncbi:MAG: LVIVD repeat-containing protein [Promethearchaeota archaeon]
MPTKLYFLNCIFIILILVVGIPKASVSAINYQYIELTKMGEIGTGGDAYDIWVDENNELAYVTCGYFGFRIFNVSIPSNPILLSHTPESPAIIETGHSTAFAHQMYVDTREDIITYIGDGAGGLKIMNCSDPHNPYVIATFAEGYAWTPVIIEDTGFVVNGFMGRGNPGFMIFNVSNPINPSLIFNYTTSVDVVDLGLVDNRAYIATSNGEMIILDISNYSSPSVLGEYIGSLGSFLGEIEVFENIAFLVYWEDGLKICDASDPLNITVIGIFEETHLTSFFLDVDTNIGYLASYDDGLVVLNLTDLTSPQEIGRYKDTGKVYRVMKRKNLIYITDQDEGLKILKMEFMNSSQTQISSSTDSSFEKSFLSTSARIRNTSTPSFELLVGILVLLVTRKRKS